MKLSEITLERVKEAYTKTGLKPANGIGRYKPGCACALEALAMDIWADKARWPGAIEGEVEMKSFYAGFDGLHLFYGINLEAYYLGKSIAKGLGL